MDDSLDRENREKEKTKYWDLFSVATASVGYQAMYFCKESRMTSSYTGDAWLRELMDEEVHPIRCYHMFRMHRDVFNNLTHDLITSYQGSRNIDVAEKVGMFLHILGHGISNRLAQERFQCFGETISRHFSLVLNKVCDMGKDLIQPTDWQFKEVPEKIKKDRRFYPYFKVSYYCTI